MSKHMKKDMLYGNKQRLLSSLLIGMCVHLLLVKITHVLSTHQQSGQKQGGIYDPQNLQNNTIMLFHLRILIQEAQK